MSKSGIYKIVNKVNGKCYVGSAVDLNNRFCCHRYDLRNQCHINQKLQHAWNKYGEDSFVFEVLEFVDGKDELIKKEQAYLDSMDVFRGGYNICKKAGSRLGMKHTEHSKVKMSIRHKNISLKTRLKMSESHKGKRHSPELIAKIVANRIGKPLSAEHRKKLSIIHTGKKMSDEARKKMSLAKIGTHRTQETKDKISKSTLGKKKVVKNNG